jgi:hypothetical protein
MIAGKKDDQHIGIGKIPERVSLAVSGGEFKIRSFLSDIQCKRHCHTSCRITVSSSPKFGGTVFLPVENAHDGHAATVISRGQIVTHFNGFKLNQTLFG